MPALTPLVAKCYGTRPADVFFRMDSGETRTIARPSGVHLGDPMEPANILPGVATEAEAFEREGVEVFAYMDGVSLGLTWITANTVRAFAFLRRELDGIGIVINAAKTVALPPE